MLQSISDLPEKCHSVHHLQQLHKVRWCLKAECYTHSQSKRLLEGVYLHSSVENRQREFVLKVFNFSWVLENKT